jgi:hypothetical protein
MHPHIVYLVTDSGNVVRHWSGSLESCRRERAALKRSGVLRPAVKVGVCSDRTFRLAMRAFVPARGEAA